MNWCLRISRSQFIGYFVAIAQGNKKQKLPEVRCILLHTIDDLLRKLNDLYDEHSQEPASNNKKLKQGSAYWGTHKIVLGCIIEMILLTLELSQHCKD
jgi:hypothetical protein